MRRIQKKIARLRLRTAHFTLRREEYEIPPRREEPARRRDVVLALWQLAGSPKTSRCPFRDVERDGSAAAIGWAYRKGLVNGYEDGTFRPGAAVSRQQLAVILYRWAGRMDRTVAASGTKLITEFSDFADISAWARQGVQWMLTAGLMEGKDDCRFDPDGNVSYGQLAQILGTYLKKYRAAEAALFGKTVKIQVFGDSISDNTWGDLRTWVNFLPDHLKDGRIELVNNAIGGSALTSVPDKSNCVTKLACNGKMLHPDSDLVVIFAGTNDWACEIEKIGAPGDDDPATVCGAVKALIAYIRARCDARILFITPIQRFNYKDRACTQQDAQGNPLNDHGYSLLQFVDAIEAACAYHGVECLDLYRGSGITRENIVQYTIDGLHPNVLGDLCIAARIYAKLEELQL